MPDAYISEIRLMAFPFAPSGWALCNGQLLAINQNAALFSAIGIAYGGNGQTTFALPNLQGRVPMHVGNGFTLGQIFGENTHTLTTSEMAAHNHLLSASATAASSGIPGPTLALAQAATGATTPIEVDIYAPQANPTVTFDSSVIGMTGSNLAHENRQPFTVLNFCICVSGIFPSHN